jgi:hypothetical protein
MLTTCSVCNVAGRHMVFRYAAVLDRALEDHLDTGQSLSNERRFAVSRFPAEEVEKFELFIYKSDYLSSVQFFDKWTDRRCDIIMNPYVEDERSR